MVGGQIYLALRALSDLGYARVSILVAPGGKIVWRHNGVIDRATTVAALADAMTRYYQPEPEKK